MLTHCREHQHISREPVYQPGNPSSYSLFAMQKLVPPDLSSAPTISTPGAAIELDFIFFFLLK
jgi:hypothetical protein